MGGTVSLELAARSDRISAVVLIDSVILPQTAFVGALRPFADALRGQEYREAIRETLSSLFLTTDDAERKSTLLSAICHVPQHVLESSQESHYRLRRDGGRKEMSFADVIYCGLPQNGRP